MSVKRTVASTRSVRAAGGGAPTNDRIWASISAVSPSHGQVLVPGQLDEHRLGNLRRGGSRSLDRHHTVVDALECEHRLVDRLERVPRRQSLLHRRHVAAGDRPRSAPALQPAPGGVSVRDAGQPAITVQSLPPVHGGPVNEVQPLLVLLFRHVAAPTRIEAAAAAAFSRMSRSTRLGRAAATRHAVTPPSEAPITSGARDLPRPYGQELVDPLLDRGRRLDRVRSPRAGLVIDRDPGERASSVKRARIPGTARTCPRSTPSRGSDRISAGPSPNTCQAMFTPSCSRKFVRGISMRCFY